MKKIISSAFVFMLFYSINAQTVPLVLKNPGNGKISSMPFCVGIPFPKGTLKDTLNLKLMDSAGNEIPFQLQQLNSWPQDKSIQWLMLDFFYDLNGKSRENMKLELNSASALKEVKDGIILKETPNDIEINTGAAVFTVSKERFNLFDMVMVNQKSIVSKDEKNLNLYFKDRDGSVFASCFGAPDDVKLELKGQVRSVIKAEGWFYSEKGEKSCRYIVRLNFFKGKSFVKMNHYHPIRLLKTDDFCFF